MVCAGHTNLGLSTLLFMARTNHMLHTECSNGAAIDCNMLVRIYVRPSRFKGQLVMCMRVTRGNMQIQGMEGRADQAFEFLAMDLTQ